jgi:hypothetical protein
VQDIGFKTNFPYQKNELKVNLAKWNQHLDSEDVRECGSLPEVAYIRKDDYSDDESSFFSNSIRNIMSFEYDEKVNPDDSSSHQSIILLKIYLQVSPYPLTYPTLRTKAKLST